MGDAEAAASSVRFSLGEETTVEDVRLALTAAAAILGRGAPDRPD
jgi:cysteine sulfinate desulfinase/cysteine desulfurase-like protein